MSVCAACGERLKWLGPDLLNAADGVPHAMTCPVATGRLTLRNVELPCAFCRRPTKHEVRTTARGLQLQRCLRCFRGREARAFPGRF